MNSVHLIGRLTRDVEIRYTSGTQKAVARFTLAVNRRKKDDGADFISCIAWDKTAEIMDKYLHKGSLIGITGHIQTGSYESNGRRVYTTDVIVERLDFLESRKSGSQSNDDAFIDVDQTDEDLPF